MCQARLKVKCYMVTHWSVTHTGYTTRGHVARRPTRSVVTDRGWPMASSGHTRGGLAATIKNDHCIVTSLSGWLWRIVMMILSVCLSARITQQDSLAVASIARDVYITSRDKNHTAELRQFFSARMSPVAMTRVSWQCCMRHGVVYFRFCGWRRVLTCPMARHLYSSAATENIRQHNSRDSNQR